MRSEFLSEPLLPWQQNLLEGELSPGEELVWIGSPISNRLAKSNWPILLFATCVLVFAIVWMVAGGALSPNGKGIFVERYFWMFGIPIALFAFLLFAAAIFGYAAGKRTVYAITDRRAIIIPGGYKVRFEGYAPEEMCDFSVSENKDGSGTIYFAETYRRMRRDAGENHRRMRPRRRGFEHVRDVRNVEGLLEMLRERAGKPVA